MLPRERLSIAATGRRRVGRCGRRRRRVHATVGPRSSKLIGNCRDEPLTPPRTPRGGTREFITSLGVGSRDGVRPGLDLKGGRPDGTSRGFAFIPPPGNGPRRQGRWRPTSGPPCPIPRRSPTVTTAGRGSPSWSGRPAAPGMAAARPQRPTVGSTSPVTGCSPARSVMVRDTPARTGKALFS